MSHSCQSNLQHEHSQQNGTMVLIAQRTIEEGEELTIRYIDTVQGNIFIWKKYVDMSMFFLQLLPNCWHFWCQIERL